MSGQHQWIVDAPTGVWKNHAVSDKVFRATIANTKTMQFVMPVDGYGRKQGESVTLKRVSNLTDPTSAVLQENKRIPEDTISFSTKAITVSEIGRSVTFTNYADELSPINIPSEVEIALQKQMAKYLDKEAMGGFQNAKVKAIPTAEGTITFDTDGTPSSAGVANLNYTQIEQIRDYLFSTLHAEPFSGDEFFSLAATKALRGVKQDPKFEVWNRYTNPEAKATGEVGKVEGIRFVEVNNTNVLSASKGTGGVQGEAVFFGANPVAMAQVLAPHIRVQSNGDFGRSMAAAWYGILDFDIVWDTANAGEANVIHYTSS